MLDINKAQKINDLRRKILENIDNGREPDHGIGEAQLKEAILALRGERINVGRKAKKEKATAVAPVDLDKLLGV